MGLTCTTVGVWHLEAYVFAWVTLSRVVLPIGVRTLLLLVPAFINMNVEHSMPKQMSARNVESTMMMASLKRHRFPQAACL